MRIGKWFRIGLIASICLLVTLSPAAFAQDIASDQLTASESQPEDSRIASASRDVISPSPRQSADPTPPQSLQSDTTLRANLAPSNLMSVSPQPSPVIAIDPVLVSHFRFSDGIGFEYIELYNSAEEIIGLNNLELKLLYSDQTLDYQCQVMLEGYILAQQYISLALNPAEGIYQLEDCPQPGGQLFNRELQVIRNGVIVESVRILATDLPTSQTSKAWERKGWTSSYREGLLANDFKTSTRPNLLYTSQLYSPPLAPALDIVEIMIQPNLCPPDSQAKECNRYVKLQNKSNQTIDLSKYRLRSGQRGEVASRYNTTLLSGVVPAGEFGLIQTGASGEPLALDDEEAALWFEDIYGVASYPNPMTPYQKANNLSNRGLVWALDSRDQTWKWGVANPYSAETVFMLPSPDETTSDDNSLVPCRADQERNPATNRCRLITSASSSLAPCLASQERNPTTNRCRSTASLAVASLKACASNQIRNPATNRCKSSVSTTSVLKPCTAGQERNPDTNRCRKSGDILPATAAFAPEIVKDGAKAFAAWWALGGIVGLGLGWVIWEYRFEIKRIIEQMTVGSK